MTRECAEHSGAFLGEGRVCLFKCSESGSPRAVRVGVCGGEISGRKRSDPGFQDWAGWGSWRWEGGSGHENPDLLFPLLHFLNRNTRLRWPRAVRAAEPENLPSLFLRIMRKTPAYLYRRAGVWILSRRGLWGS